MNKTIKTCPHCGGSASLISKYAQRTGGYFVFVRCDICGASAKTYASQEDPSATWDNEACMDAVSAWNMRTGAQNEAE